MRSKAVCVGLVFCGAFLSWLVAGEIDWKTQTCSEKQLRDGTAKTCYQFCDHWKFIDQHLYKTCITNTVPPCLGCRPATKLIDEPPSYIEQCTLFTGFSCSFFEVSDSAMNVWNMYASKGCQAPNGFLYSFSSPWCVCLPGWGGHDCQTVRSMEYCHNDTRYVGGCVEVFYDVKCGEISKEVVECDGTNMCAPSNFCPPQLTAGLDSNACYTPQCLLNDPSCLSPSKDLFYCADGTCSKEASECKHLVSPIITPLTKVFNMDQKEDLNIPFLSYDKGVFAGALRIPPGTFKQNTIIQAQPMRYGEGELYFSYPNYYGDYYHVVYRAIISSTISLNASFEMGGRELEADEFHEPIEIYFQASRDVQKGERACVAYFDEGLSAWVCLDDTTLASGDTSPQVYCGVTHHFTNFALLIGTIPDKEDGNDGYDESGFDSSSEVGSESVSGAVLLPPGQLW